MSKDIEKFINEYIEGLAESHVEGWKSRYEYKDAEDVEYDLRVNHDLSIEVDIAEEYLGRGLTSTEYDDLNDEFIKEVLYQLYN